MLLWQPLRIWKNPAILLCSGLVLGGFIAWGQTPTATLTGQVKDATGAAVAGARVAARHVQTNLTRHAIVRETGDYTLPLLSIGEYQITVEQSGFKKAVQNGVLLQVDQKARLDFQLEIGQLSERVEVVADASPVQTDSSSIGTVIDNKKIAELPLNSREFYALALTAPNVLPPAQGSFLAFRGGLNIAGSSEVANNFTLNGIDNNDLATNGPSFRPSIDAIEEFKLVTGIYSAEYGRNSGGQIVIRTKSGTNQFHGSAYEFLRNQALDARNFFVDVKPDTKRSLFGGTIGGPVIADKTFFFASFEGLRLRQSISALATVPTTAMLSGDFRAIRRAGPDGVLGTADDVNRVLEPLTGAEFPIPNVIPTTQLDPIGLALAKFYPAPRSDTSLGALPSNNYSFSQMRRENYNQVSLRLDHALSTRDALYSTFNFYDNPAYEPSNTLCGARVLPAFGCTTGLTTMLAGVVQTHTFSANLNNEIRLGYNRLRQPRVQEDSRIDFAKQVGLAGMFFGAMTNNTGVPQTAVTGFSTFGSATNLPQDRADNTFQVVDNLIWTRAAHTFQFGLDIRRFQSNFYIVQAGRGSYTFTAAATAPTSGYPLADLLLGYPTSASRNPFSPMSYPRSSSINGYIQDDWKIARGLTLNLGLRWEFNTPLIERYNNIASFNPASGQVVVPGKDGAPNTLFDFDYNNFAPRLGFAWQPFGSGKTAVRGGFGLFYNTQPTNNGFSFLYFNFPIRFPQTINNSRATPFTFATAFSSVEPVRDARTPPPGNVLNISGVDRNFATAYISQWGLTVQHELSPQMVFEASYLGSKGTHLPISRNLNQPVAAAGTTAQVNARRPYQPFGNIIWLESVANSSFHSMALKLEKRFSRGNSFLAGYTLGKSIDNSPGISTVSIASSSMVQDTRNLAAERGLSDFDIRQRFVLSTVQEIPLGRGHRHFKAGLPASVFGGWQISGIVTLNTGRPFTAYISNNLSNTFNSVFNQNNTLNLNDRPNLIGDANSGPHTVDRWFNTAAFQLQSLGNFGTAGRNIITSPGYQNIDLALSRNFKVKERIRLQFRGELFNAFNHANFNYPAPIANSTATFGKITSALDPRQIQFGLKVIF